MILAMIKINCTSPTAPYRYKNINRLPVDENVTCLSRLDIIDDYNNDIDNAGQSLFRMDLIRWIFERLELEDLEHFIFQYRFFENEEVKNLAIEIQGSKLYHAYNNVTRAIHEILTSERLTNGEMKGKSYNTARVKAITTSFFANHLQSFRVEIHKTKSILECEY